MPGKAIKVGPFDDGLNNVSLAGEARDTEVVELINFEVAPDGSLQSRPAIKVVTESFIAGTGQLHKVYGIYRATDTDWSLIVARAIGSNKWNIEAYPFGIFGGTPTFLKEITGKDELPTGYVQFNNAAYMCKGPKATTSALKWIGTGAATDVAAMPKGNSMIAYKSRLWIAGSNTAGLSSTLYFSTIDTAGAKPEVWGASDFINIAPGEGGFITGLLALNSAILIFKSDGTWRFSYPSNPATGQVDKVSGSVGAANADSFVEFENYVYVYDQGKLYELVNNNYTQLNRYVKMDEDPYGSDFSAPGVSVSVLDRRIVVNYFNTTYAFALDSKTWSQWRTEASTENPYAGTPGKFFELPTDSASTAPSTYIAASTGLFTGPAVRSPVTFMTFTGTYPDTPLNLESIKCLMRTKTYDYQAPSALKRLFWWAIEMKTNREMKATVIPVTRQMLPLWGDLEAYTHEELEAGTWGNPLSFLNKIISIFDGGDPSVAQAENGRILGKFTRSLRFRQVIFEIEMSTVGNLDSLAKVYSLTTYVVPKEKVVDKFN